MPIKLTLGWPLSVNHYWVFSSRGTFISKKGKAYLLDANHRTLGLQHNVKDRLKVSVHAFPPDRRKRDLDNILKVTGDCLQKSGVILDDNQIDEWHVYRCEVSPPGRLELLIEQREFEV